MPYVIRKASGLYVAPSGWRSSYVYELQNARIFSTESEAETERCKENETVVEIHKLLRRPEPR